MHFSMHEGDIRLHHPIRSISTKIYNRDPAIFYLNAWLFYVYRICSHGCGKATLRGSCKSLQPDVELLLLPNIRTIASYLGLITCIVMSKILLETWSMAPKWLSSCWAPLGVTMKPYHGFHGVRMRRQSARPIPKIHIWCCCSSWQNACASSISTGMRMCETVWVSYNHMRINWIRVDWS